VEIGEPHGGNFFEPFRNKSDFLFFLSRPDTGETVFSKTFKEHEMNVEKHL